MRETKSRAEDFRGVDRVRLSEREWTTVPDAKAPHLSWVQKIRNGKLMERYNAMADWQERAEAVAAFLNDYEEAHPEVR